MQAASLIEAAFFDKYSNEIFLRERHLLPDLVDFHTGYPKNGAVLKISESDNLAAAFSKKQVKLKLFVSYNLTWQLNIIFV